ncbi:MAG: REP element-mobilizing transposase RayT [Limisphaerales bacterium]|jgi:REP element-mobilizing transposase RayT
MVVIREKRHRLPANSYKGQVTVAFTINTFPPGAAYFQNEAIVQIGEAALAEAFENNHGHVAVYVIMPDHVHLIVSGSSPESDLLRLVKEFKQKTTFRVRKSGAAFAWQKDFWDHVIRDRQDYANQVHYILRNPVRKGLCLRWEDWAHRGVLGQTWEDLARNIAMV